MATFDRRSHTVLHAPILHIPIVESDMQTAPNGAAPIESAYQWQNFWISRFFRLRPVRVDRICMRLSLSNVFNVYPNFVAHLGESGHNQVGIELRITELVCFPSAPVQADNVAELQTDPRT